MSDDEYRKPSTIIYLAALIALLVAAAYLLRFIFSAPIELPIENLAQEQPELRSQVSDNQAEASIQENENAAEDEVDARFVKISESGEKLDDDANSWNCVYDHSTGLLWEVKLTDGGLQDAEYSYSWTRQPTPDEVDAKGSTDRLGIVDKGSCHYIECDTSAYVDELNQRGLCGLSDWRMPLSDELRSLEHPTRYYPDIYTEYFPNTISGPYWTGTEVKASSSLAWSVDFNNGFPYISEKRLAAHIRLVSEGYPTEQLK